MKLAEVTEFNDDPSSWKSNDNSWQGIKYHFNRLINTLEQADKIIELQIVTPTDEETLERAKKIYRQTKNKLIKNEHLWAQMPYCAYEYAVRIRKGRFTEGEPAIATVGKYAFSYAMEILRHRFFKGEPAIAQLNRGKFNHKERYEAYFECTI